MIAGIYYRVSTRDKQDLGMQKKVIQEYCERENVKIYKEYEDHGISGSKESRPGFDKLMSDMRDNKFNAIMVYKLDRIGRSLSHLVKMFEEFNKKDIKFISVTQNFNTETPEGRLQLGMMMLLAQYEREITINRIHDGLASAKSKGKTLGRPRGSKDTKRRRTSGYVNRWLEKNK